mmetsp:Transcript_52453/g.170330  ORF Transcript_52453/g.170330 Transcript_52453/m.170330 type:complete len:409 (-) Transcript_52453:599-1825(-)
MVLEALVLHLPMCGNVFQGILLLLRDVRVPLLVACPTLGGRGAAFGQVVLDPAAIAHKSGLADVATTPELVAIHREAGHSLRRCDDLAGVPIHEGGLALLAAQIFVDSEHVSGDFCTLHGAKLRAEAVVVHACEATGAVVLHERGVKPDVEGYIAFKPAEVMLGGRCGSHRGGFGDLLTHFRVVHAAIVQGLRVAAMQLPTATQIHGDTLGTADTLEVPCVILAEPAHGVPDDPARGRGRVRCTGGARGVHEKALVRDRVPLPLGTTCALHARKLARDIRVVSHGLRNDTRARIVASCVHASTATFVSQNRFVLKDLSHERHVLVFVASVQTLDAPTLTTAGEDLVAALDVSFGNLRTHVEPFLEGCHRPQIREQQLAVLHRATVDSGDDPSSALDLVVCDVVRGALV